MDDLEERLRQPAVFAEPAESQRCHLVMQEAADRLRTYREVVRLADEIRQGIKDGGLKRRPELYVRVMNFDATRKALPHDRP